MNLFKKLKKRSNELNLHSVSTGLFVPISEVKDDVFSQKMLGDGFAIRSNIKEVYSPISGVVTSVFPTKHAIGLKSETGVEVLVHMGIDTVELQGRPFEVFVKEGDMVIPSTKIADIDLAMLDVSNKQSDILVIITSGEAIDFQMTSSINVSANDLVGNIIFN
ncbi:PTS sugar transporter subunit IIA [Vagococcus elongatus]|uniref:Sugar permease n=1 Tax=Vagococcus elongatus TaxID=180344 RepID=A0A430AMC5_9ENTE|nr:PTS glucose transporter subunit IIA [Vagococcus elongatus]RSU09282.1 sugar permease [Vagococcus elongatus]